MVNPQQIQKLHPEFTKPAETLEKSLLNIEKVLVVTRNEKIDVWIADDPTKYDTLIYSRGAYNNKKYAGSANINLSNEINFTARLYSPENIFYEIFTSSYQLEHYPSQTLIGTCMVNYNEYIESKPIYMVNDYGVTFDSSSEVIGGITYNFASPIVTDNYIPTTSLKVKVLGYVVEWHGQDYNTTYDFINTSDLLKYSVGTYNNKRYAGGSMQLPGVHSNTTVYNGYLKATAATGTFTSTALLTSIYNIEKIKLTKKEILNSGTITYEISADNGTNWQVIDTFDNFVDVANIGKVLRVRITLTGSALLDSLYIETDEFSVTSGLSDSNTKIEIGNDIEGWTTITNDLLTNIALNEVKYKVTNIMPRSELYLRLVRLEYNV